MKVDVYDTHATSQAGDVIHFDVLVPSDVDADTAFSFAKCWLNKIGQESIELSQSQCKFCHQEHADDVVAACIEREGCYILQMEGCPNPR